MRFLCRFLAIKQSSCLHWIAIFQALNFQSKTITNLTEWMKMQLNFHVLYVIADNATNAVTQYSYRWILSTNTNTVIRCIHRSIIQQFSTSVLLIKLYSMSLHVNGTSFHTYFTTIEFVGWSRCKQTTFLNRKIKSFHLCCWCIIHVVCKQTNLIKVFQFSCFVDSTKKKYIKSRSPF